MRRLRGETEEVAVDRRALSRLDRRAGSFGHLLESPYLLASRPYFGLSR